MVQQWVYDCAPAYAIIVMFGLEYDVVTNFKPLLYYTRYIDDVFFIVNKGYVHQCREFLDSLVEWIKFVWNGNGELMDFLNLTIFKAPNFSGRFSFKVFQKCFLLYHCITLSQIILAA